MVGVVWLKTVLDISAKYHFISAAYRWSRSCVTRWYTYTRGGFVIMPHVTVSFIEKLPGPSSRIPYQ